jgi:hypothetical protein
MFNSNDFLQSISLDYNFIQLSPRSQDRMSNTLRYLGAQIESIFSGNNYSVTYPGRNQVHGQYYVKQVPIIVSKNEIPVFVMTCHFVGSGLKKNIINNFEHMLGVSANIQLNDVKFCNILIFQNRCPTKSRGQVTGYDFLDETDLSKYLNLSDDVNSAHKPFTYGVFVIETPVAGQSFLEAPLAGFSAVVRNQINRDLAVASSFMKIAQLRQDLGD